MLWIFKGVFDRFEYDFRSNSYDLRDWRVQKAYLRENAFN